MNNFGVIFKRTLLDSRQTMIGWGLGVGILSFIEMLIYPAISEAFGAFEQLLESPIYQVLLGDAAGAGFTTPEGYVATYVILFTPIYLAVYLVTLALGMTLREEDRGTIDLLLSTPIPRWQVIVEKFLALIVTVLVIVGLTYVLTLFGTIIIPDLAIPPLRLAEGIFSMMPIMLVIAAIALFFSTILRSPGRVGAVVGALLVASYFLTTLSQLATETLGTLKYLSIFTYHQSTRVMLDGIVWGDVLVLLVITVILFGLSLVMFQRRDLAV